MDFIGHNMNNKIIIAGTPNFVFYDNVKPNDYDLEYDRLIDVTDIITELNQSGGEVANITVNIDNIGGELTKYLDSWFNAIVEYWQDGTLFFQGSIATIQSDSTIQLTVVA